MVLIFLLIIFVGAIVYNYIEGWAYLDSLYFTVATITTVGYGDFVPLTDVGKIFTIIFSFVGIAMVFCFFSIIGDYIFKKTFEKKLKVHHTKLIKHFNLKLKKAKLKRRN